MTVQDTPKTRTLWRTLYPALRSSVGVLSRLLTPRRSIILLRRLHQAVLYCRGLAISVVTIGAILAILVSIAWEMRQATVTIEPILVPSRFNDMGYTPHIAAQRLLAEINTIKDGAATYMDTLDIDYRLALSGLPSTPDFVLPSLGMSLRATAAYLLRLFGRTHPVVTGEFSYDDDDSDSQTPWLHVRVNDRNVAQFAGMTVDNLLKRAAAEVVRATEPYVLAAYLYVNDDTTQAEAVLSDMLANVWTENAPWALNLQGIMLDERERYDEALEKYRRAVTLDPELPITYHNVGNVLFAKGDYDAAISMYEKALDLEPRFAAASYRILGRAYINIGESETAIAKYKMACELDPRLCEDMEKRVVDLEEEGGAR